MMYRCWPIRFPRLGFLVYFAVSLLAAGPALAQPYDWQVSDGPNGGGVFTLAQAPIGDIYAGAWEMGGVFRSTDQGLTWQEVGLHDLPVSEIVIDNAGTVYVAATTYNIYRSTNHGASWQECGTDLVGHWGSLAYDPVLDIVFAAKGDVISRSIDGGDTWQTVDTDFPHVNVRALAVAPDGGPMFVGTDLDKVYRSDDGGVTWFPFADGINSARVDDFHIGPGEVIYAASFAGGIYAAEFDDTSWTQFQQGLGGFCVSIGRDPGGSLWAGTVDEGIYVSHNEGLNWALASAGLEKAEVWDFLALDSSHYLVGTFGGGVFRTDNAGATWNFSSSGMNQASVNVLLKAGNGDLFAATWGAGVHRSIDGGLTWEPCNNGILDPEVNDIVQHPDGDLFCGTFLTHIYRSTDGGDGWNPTGSVPAIQRAGCLAVKPGTGDLFAGGRDGGGVWRSPDKGNSWFPANTGIDDLRLNQLIVEDDGDLSVVTYYDGIYRSEDDGGSWFPINNGLPASSVSQILSLPGGVLFAAVPYHGLYRSLDDGANWNLVDASLDETRLRTVAANPSGFIFAGAEVNGIVFQSTDGGDTWFEVSGAFPGVWLSDLAFNDNGQLLAGTRGFGVIYTDQTTPVQLRGLAAERSTDGAVTVSWSLPEAPSHLVMDVYRAVGGGARERLSADILTRGPDFTFLDAAAPAEACEYWLCLTDSFGETSWYGPVNVDKVDLGISRLAIEAVWPNPASGSATIRMAVPLSETARLDVYDLRGRLVRSLRRDVGGSGSLEAVWDGRDDQGSLVASGTYFLRLLTDSKVVTGKVVLIGHRR